MSLYHSRALKENFDTPRYELDNFGRVPVDSFSKVLKPKKKRKFGVKYREKGRIYRKKKIQDLRHYLRENFSKGGKFYYQESKQDIGPRRYKHIKGNKLYLFLKRDIYARVFSVYSDLYGLFI